MKKQSHNIHLVVAVLIMFIMFTYPQTISHNIQMEEVALSAVAKYWHDLNETSSGLASGSATPDGRPLLWKSRDRSAAQNMEYHYVDDGRIPFISVTDNGEDDEYYGGVNAAGFAVENTDAHNFPAPNPNNGWSPGLDDGETMFLALATCRTVDDFQALLDSLNVPGRTYDYNYGVFDAFGGAAIFEAAAYTYTRFDAIDEPDGFIVRSNYAYTGDDLRGNDLRYGIHRHDQTQRRFKQAYEAGNLTAEYIVMEVTHDLTSLVLDPYPLPYEGYQYDFPYGCIDNRASMCRWTTRAVMVAHGAGPDDHPDDAMIWATVGSPLSGIATPLWVRAGSIPVEYDGENSSLLCDRYIQLRTWLYEKSFDAVDTWRLVNPQGTGLWDFIFPFQRKIIDKTNRFLNSPEFSYDRLEAFQNLMARQVADSIYAWQPAVSVTEISEPVFLENNIVLYWTDQEDDGGGGLNGVNEPAGYVVYRSEQPFRENAVGDSLGYVESSPFIDFDPFPGGSYYRIEARY